MKLRFIPLILLLAVLASAFGGCSSLLSPAQTSASDTSGAASAGTTAASSASASDTASSASSASAGSSESHPDTIPPTTLFPSSSEATEPTSAATEPTSAATEPTSASTEQTTVTTASQSFGSVIEMTSIIAVGDAGMEQYYGVDSVLKSYASTVSKIKRLLPSCNVYAMFCPSSIEFNAPAKYQAGTRSQLAAMNKIIDNLTDGAIGVKTWYPLNDHRSEYIYFRTDHHWTQRGAYYAYTAFAEAAGFTPHALSEYKTETVSDFVGTMYYYADNDTVKQRFLSNPDYVEIFRPINSSVMTVYANGNLTNGSTRPLIVSAETAAKYNKSGKYMVFISGDNPISHIVSDTVKNGKVLIVTKESYGNCLVPFLTDHCEQIYVIDPREFNADGKPSLNLVDFANKVGATDIVCVNASMLLSGLTKYIGRMLP